MIQCNSCGSSIGGYKVKVKYKEQVQSEWKVKQKTLRICTCCSAFGIEAYNILGCEENEIIKDDVVDFW